MKKTTIETIVTTNMQTLETVKNDAVQYASVKRLSVDEQMQRDDNASFVFSDDNTKIADSRASYSKNIIFARFTDSVKLSANRKTAYEIAFNNDAECIIAVSEALSVVFASLNIAVARYEEKHALKYKYSVSVSDLQSVCTALNNAVYEANKQYIEAQKQKAEAQKQKAQQKQTDSTAEAEKQTAEAQQKQTAQQKKKAVAKVKKAVKKTTA